ncbi:hypothetical protein CN918_30310 [Priestia megaterium]|nr:hypothetical protein CN918_30310 [Priestia megaterium]
MKSLNFPLLFLFCSMLMACNQETISDPANPKVNAEVPAKADFHTTITTIDEKNKKILSKGIKDHKEVVVLIDEKYYSLNNFHKGDVIDVWIDEHSTLTGKNPLVITNPAKIDWDDKKK